MMMTRRRKFYTPGLISLIGLPILVFFLMPKPAQQDHTFRIFLPKDYVKSPAELDYSFSKQGFYKSIRGRKIIRVEINDRIVPGDTGLISAKMNFIFREMERLIFTRDSTTVLKVVIGESNTLGDFIRIVNMAAKCQVKRWILADDSFYFISYFPGENKNLQVINLPLLSL